MDSQDRVGGTPRETGKAPEAAVQAAATATPADGAVPAAPAEGAACGGNEEEAATPPPAPARAGDVIEIPEGVEIVCVEAEKGYTKLTLFLSDGSKIVIDDPDHMPTIIVDGMEVPRSTLQTLMGDCVVQPASLPGSGGNFARPIPDIGDAFPLTPLLPPTELPREELPERDFVEVIEANDIPDIAVFVDEASLDFVQDGLDLAPGAVEGSGPGGTAETVTGALDLSGTLGGEVTAVTIDNVTTAVAGTTQITTPHGVLEIDPDGSFVFTLTHPADHSGGPVTEDFIVEVTDNFGNTFEVNLTVNIIDDEPLAQADFANADTDAVQSGDVLTGNVITDGDGDGIDESDTLGADGGTVTGVSTSDSGTGPVAGNVGVTLPDENGLGTLILNADGSYEFEAAPNASGTAVYTYTITDGDGDTSTTTLTIEVTDGSPEVEDETAFVDEAGLDLNQDGDDLAAGTVTGSNPGATSETVSGTISFTDADAPAVTSVSFGATTVAAGAQIAGDFGVLVVNADGSYTYTLTANADHSGGPVSEVFTVEVTDSFGNMSTATLTVNIADDEPAAAADTDAVQSGATAAGNVITDAEANGDNGADTPGADGATVTGVQAGDTGGSDVSGDVGTQIAGSFGTLTLNADGSYSYEADPNVSGTDVFTYTLTDGDGDTSTTTLTIEVTDGSPNAEDVTVSVEEFALDLNEDGDDLAPGNVTGTNPGSTQETVQGTFVFGDTDDVEITTVNGNAVIAGVAIAGAFGLLLIDPETGEFTYTLTDPADHSGGPVTEVFNVVVTDEFGNTSQGTITINIGNDAPVINEIQSAVLANETGTVTGTIDGAFGADGFDSYTLALQNTLEGVTVTTQTLGDGSEQLTATIDSSGDTFFTLTFHPDGTYTFELVTERPTEQTTESLGGVTPGGPVPSVTVGIATFTADPGQSMNASAQGLGVGNNQLETGEGFTVTFDEPISNITFEVDHSGGGPLNIAIVVTNTATLETEVINTAISADGTITIDPSFEEFDKVEIDGISGSGKVRFDAFTTTKFITPEDLSLLFDVTVTDTDGDSDSGTLQVDLVGGDGTSFTLTGTAGSDVLLGASTDDVLSALGGDDVLIGGGGSDTYTGGAGADVFVIDPSSLGMAIEDLITDYDAGEGDVIDLTELFDDPTPADVSDYVQYNSVTGELQVDADGGGDSFVTVATVQSGGVPVASVTILYDDGSTEQPPATV